MKFVLPLFLAVLLLAPVMRAQDTSNVARIEIVTQQQPVKLKNFYTIRGGLWFPKDMEKEFTINDITYDGTADRSQAFGLDFHFRNNVGHPLYFDVSISGWFSSYDYTKTQQIEEVETIQDVTSWTAVIPITFGLSVSTPVESPVIVYGMGGIGGYVALTGLDITGDKQENQVFVRFGAFFGAGADFMLSPGFGISIGAKYQFIEFQYETYTGQKDFTGLQAQLGVALRN